MSCATSSASGTISRRACLLALAAGALAACRWPGSTLPVIKVGFSAPFEGEQMPFGYDVYYASLLAVQDWNATTRTGGWGVELVAVDDGLDPQQAVRAAGKLAVDPDVVAVIGPFSVPAAAAGLPLLGAAGVATAALAPLPPSLLAEFSPLAFRFFLEPERAPVDSAGYAAMQMAADWPGAPPSGPVAEAYRALAGHTPGPAAVLTYDATRAVLQALAAAIRQQRQPTRAGVAAALGRVQGSGWLAPFAFHASGAVTGLPADVFVVPSKP